MNTVGLQRTLPLGALAALLGLAPLVASGGTDFLRTQTIELQSGWNAVFLEVEPRDSSPDTVFEGTPVEIAAAWLRPVSTVEYIANPESEPWNLPGWSVWFAPEREDAFLSSLYAIRGQQAYLVKASEAFQWEIEGGVRHRPIRWQAGSFNLQGFNVDPAAPPTFAEFFAGAEGRVGGRVYRLLNGEWRPVNNPTLTRLRPGEAYWIHSRGRTDYQGPVTVHGLAGGALRLSPATGETRIAIQNTGAGMTDIGLAVAGGSLPLMEVRADGFDTERHPIIESADWAGLAPGDGAVLRLYGRSPSGVADSAGAVLKITANGVIQWIPVHNANLPNEGNP